MVEKLTEDNFLLYAMHHYDNNQCHTIDEFEEDLRRFLYLKKLFNRYQNEGELKERLILNHLIVLFNVFGDALNPMLFMKIDREHWPILKPFLVYLGRLDEGEVYIPLDQRVVDTLRKI
jgi:hypothetical protein